MAICSSSITDDFAEFDEPGDHDLANFSTNLHLAKVSATKKFTAKA